MPDLSNGSQMTTRGLEGVVANTTRLSDVVGDKGQLVYAGYDINELAGKVSYEEVVFLLWNNRLPNREELDSCSNTLREDRGDAAAFRYLMSGVELTADAAQPLDLAFVLHADHGTNASTFSARVTISTLTDIYSAITAAIGTLKGPLHGGANEGVIHMLQKIGSLENVDSYIDEQLAQKKKIMGIGHRVYKTLDPRAPHVRAMAIKLSDKVGEPKWIKMSQRIAELMKQKKNLNANVDFYSATVYHSLGIPTDLFTPMFAIARCSGWCAHVLEQLEDNRLYRPLSEYVGEPVGKKVVPLKER